MQATVTASRGGLANRSNVLGACKLGKPRTNGRKRAHEAARPQELAPPASARGKIVVEIGLIDLVHVEETITGAVVERVLLDVLAENTYTFSSPHPKRFPHA